jgi:hypothetical protein
MSVLDVCALIRRRLMPRRFLLTAVFLGISDFTLAMKNEFLPSPGIYEPSGVVQLADGRLLVAEDEAGHALRLVSLEPGGGGLSGAGPLALDAPLVLDDLEGVSLDPRGFVYAITSHARTERGHKRIAQREQLVRFRLERNAIIEMRALDDLRTHIAALNPLLQKSVGKKAAKQGLGLNIEGLAVSASGEQLLLGLRSPTRAGRAIVLTLRNLQRAFAGESPNMVENTLDLDGAGIRSLSYVPRLQGYLIVTRREDKKKRPFRLWFWDGAAASRALRVSVDGIDDLRRTEAIAPIAWAGAEGLILLSDEGNAKKNRPGRYLLLRYEQLVIER